MRNPEGESECGPLRPLFDRRLKLEFHRSRVISDAGLLAYRELDDALGLTALAGGVLADSRTGRNGWHGIVSLLRQSVYGRLAGYEDVNDADRTCRGCGSTGFTTTIRRGASCSTWTAPSARHSVSRRAQPITATSAAPAITCPSYKLRPAQKPRPFRVI